MEVTRLRERPDGLVDVEVDGGAWRTLPAAAVVQSGLAPGVTLDRPMLRSLARALRRSEAVGAAARLLSRRELSSRSLETRLEQRGIRAGPRAAALAAAERAGLVDDRRYALRRAQTLAERDRGDSAIRWQLEHEGVLAAFVEDALAALEPEPDRARRIVARRGPGPRTARYLGTRGFDGEVVEAALGAEGAPGVG